MRQGAQAGARPRKTLDLPDTQVRQGAQTGANMETEENYLERASYTWSEDSIRLFATPSRTARGLFFYMQEAGYFKTVWPYFTERANLNSFLVVCTLSGEGRLQYEGREYALLEGSLFFIHCMKHHEYHTVKGKNWEFLWLHLNGMNALGYYEEFVKNGFRILDIREKELTEQTLRKIIAINQKRELTTEVRTSGLIGTLLTELIAQNTAESRQAILIPEFVRAAEKYLEQHFREKVPLQELADMLHVDRFYLIKEFGRYVGISPHEYQIELRISYAKELLKYSDLSVNEIAYACGMNQTSHFISLFREREHSTPARFRKEWRPGPAERGSREAEGRSSQRAGE